MIKSILTSIKKMLGIEDCYDHFDPELIMHINTVFSRLNQLGVGPMEGFFIEGKEETWDQYMLDRKDLHAIKSYIYLRVRLLFDPPSSAFVLTSMENQIKEFEWRINVEAEGGYDFESWRYGDGTNDSGKVSGTLRNSWNEVGC